MERMEIRPLTDEEKFQRLVLVAEWSPEEVDHFLAVCEEKGFSTPADRIRYANEVMANQCLSTLRGGDAALDAMVVEALGAGEKQENTKRKSKHGLA